MSDNKKILYKDGQSCHHKGCRNHYSHPCELCGRIAAKGDVYINKFVDSLVKEEKHLDTDNQT